jgi:hypothetical protein
MTVIAYKDGVLAADSMWRDDTSELVIYLPKVTLLRSGALYGGAGDGDDRILLKVLHDITHPKDLPTREHLRTVEYHCEAIIVFPEDGAWKVETGENGAGVEPLTVPCAIGAGASIAVGAMAAGASAEQAVSIACELHSQCRGPVNSLKFP